MERVEAIRSRLKAAHTMVSDLCHGRRDWIMSIPARRDYDPDLVIGAALSDGDKLLAIAEYSLALYRSEQAYNKLNGECDDPVSSPDETALYNVEQEARAAWNAACAEWEAQ